MVLRVNRPEPERLDPKAIDFQWHQRNFEDALGGLDKGQPPSVDGSEGRKAVELITAIYESIREGGSKGSFAINRKSID